MALFCKGRFGQNALLLPDLKIRPKSFRNVTKKYFTSLHDNIKESIENLFDTVARVYYDLYRFREDEVKSLKIVEPIKIKEAEKGNLIFDKRLDRGMRWEQEEKENKLNRTATSHRFAMKVIEDAIVNAHGLLEIVRGEDTTKPSPEIGAALDGLRKDFYRIKRRVHRVLEPSKQYLKWVINRELAASDSTFDAGELVFAATSYGAINDWRVDGKLTRACDKLVAALPDSGRLATKRPFQAHESGRRSIPIGCEMSRALANLLQRTGHDFDADFVGRMLHIFEDSAIELPESTATERLLGWNFDGAPHPDRPAVWVTAISTIALDRIVRMLNRRINEIVLPHFDVTNYERPHTNLELHDLIYADSALVHYHLQNTGRSTTAVNLQKMRAHILRASLPSYYLKSDLRSFSAIFYGPPGTGKTTLAESLALSSKVPLVKLSPSDLILQGHDFIEGRAHDVFEAISMLTRCVIIFDEFEPVIETRRKPKPKISAVNATTTPLEFDTAQMSAAIQRFSQRDDPKTSFVFGGMLPKFGKLYDAAEKQSLVYCLGTNYPGRIDDAAKRKGRFDQKIPIYKPDILSRAGTLLFRLSQVRSLPDNPPEEFCKRFIETLSVTINEPADQIAKFFTLKKDKDGKKVASGVLAYILGEKGARLPGELLVKSRDTKLKELKDDLENAELDPIEKEKEQRTWFVNYEESYLKASENTSESFTERAFGRNSLEPPSS